MIVAPSSGVLVEWLHDNDDIVAEGLPLARLQNGSEL